MKAIAIDHFGGPEILKFIELPTPVPGPGEILVRVRYAGVNPVDWKIREGYLKDALPHHFPLIPGWDLCGEVCSDGNIFKQGERVFSYCRKPEVQWGTYAEYVVVAEKDVAPAPKALSDAQAAAIPLTALTAWQALFNFAGLTSGNTVLVHAGAGGVGGLAIQFAKLSGSQVLTTARREKQAYVRSLGADVAIDYTTEEVAAAVKSVAPQGADIVFDCAGGDALEQSFDLVKWGGTLVSIVDTPDAKRAEVLGIRSGWVFVTPDGNQLREIGGLIDAGKIKPPYVEELPLAQAKEAHLKSQSHRTLGKLVLKV